MKKPEKERHTGQYEFLKLAHIGQRPTSNGSGCFCPEGAQAENETKADGRLPEPLQGKMLLMF